MESHILILMISHKLRQLLFCISMSLRIWIMTMLTSQI